MGKRVDSLLFRFGIIFAVFTFLALAMSGIITFLQQTAIYKGQREESIQHIADYLEKLILQDGEDFLHYKNYMTAHFEEIKIPHDFTQEDVLVAGEKYQMLFAKAFPGKVFGVDVTFDELPKEIKEAYVIYQHEFYTNEFEKAREAFNIIYTYVLVPTGEPLHMWWMIDVDREQRESDGMLNLCFDGLQVMERHQCMWEAWETGRRPSGYDYYDNEYGKTYAYYTPLFINGEKIGVIGVECEIADVDAAILNNSIRQMAYICLALVVLVIALLYFIYKNYISKLENLQSNVIRYTQGKDVAVAANIERNATGKDEISTLARLVSTMICELENYMDSLVKTDQLLRDTQKKADAMNELALKDALTGIRNKTAYDNEVKKIEWKMLERDFAFGIAMVDLNFLKRINDTFGHEKGNIAIKKLCFIICHVFEHSPVFRIGGDEFVILLLGEDFEKREALLVKFIEDIRENATKEELEPWERVSASIGIAVYDQDIDSNVDDVFKRADKAMYSHKKEMKAQRDS